MRIRPPGSQKPPGVASDATPRARQPAVEAGLGRAVTPPVAGKARHLAKVRESFRAADLQDPAKVEQILHASIGELLDRSFAAQLPALKGPGRAGLISSLQSDPMIRDLLLAYLKGGLQ